MIPRYVAENRARWRAAAVLLSCLSGLNCSRAPEPQARTKVEETDPKRWQAREPTIAVIAIPEHALQTQDTLNVQLADGRTLDIPAADLDEYPELRRAAESVIATDRFLAAGPGWDSETPQEVRAIGRELLATARQDAATELEKAYAGRAASGGEINRLALMSAMSISSELDRIREEAPSRTRVVTDITSRPPGVLDFTPAKESAYRRYQRGQQLQIGKYVFRIRIPGRSRVFRYVLVWPDPTVQEIRID